MAMEEFTLKERKHVLGATGGLGRGLIPVADEKLTEHISRQHTAHKHHEADQAPAEQQQQQQQQQNGASYWITSYQALTSGDASQQRRKVGKRCFQAPHQLTSTGLFSGFGERHVSETERIAQLQLGTTKASQHLPGYTGHITATRNARSLPIQERDLDKSKPLITLNYNPVPGYTGRLR